MNRRRVPRILKSFSKRKLKGPSFVEDDFSRELAKQGKDGNLMRLLYLCNPMEIYIKKVTDEPIHY